MLVIHYITGLSHIAFDHKQIIMYFYLTLNTCLIKVPLTYTVIDVDYACLGVNNTSNFKPGVHRLVAGVHLVS